MNIRGPVHSVSSACERVLRTLPDWFGIEESLLEYARNTEHLPTFVAEDGSEVVGFLSLEEHFPECWEVNCIAVNGGLRGHGIGRRLQAAAESWLERRGARVLQVKTLAAAHPSAEYAETRRFYEALGYLPLEVHPTLWSEDLPVLQLVKCLGTHPEDA